MKKLLALLGLAALMLAGVAGAAITNIAQLPILNVDGTGNVRPNLMLLYDNSGSMASNFTPDYIDDSSTCRSRATMAGGTRGCSIGQPPFAASDFNRQYYNPAVRYLPPVNADGTSFASQTSANTSGWTSVPTDGHNINRVDLLGTGTSSTNLVSGFPDLAWCDTNGYNCVYNTATYTYPNDVRYTAAVALGNPYYYNIRVAEYCTTPALTTCVTTAVGAAAPANYPYPAKIRWCDSRALTNCQAKYVGNFKYPRFSNPNAGVVAAYGTVTVGASASNGAITINGVSVAESGGAVVITNASVVATAGTNTPTKQQEVATKLAASIIAKTGLTNQYLACVRTPTSGYNVPACSTYGITLGTDNVVAVVPVNCPSGATTKSLGTCSLVADNARSGWAITVDAPAAIVQAAQPATALITVSGTAFNSTSSSRQTKLAAGTLLGSKQIISSDKIFGQSASNTTVAANIRSVITNQNGVTAYAGGNAITPACAAKGADTICVADTTLTTGGAAITMGALTNNGNISFALTAASPPVAAVYDTIPMSTTALGSGGAVFVRVDIIPSVTSYPKATTRTDCAGSTCTYDEEMTNFANWYAYYKTRNQMMKTAVGHAFQALNSNYNVGIVSLSAAAAGTASGMIAPQQFTGTPRTNWYARLYAMNGNSATPLRPALHAVGKMYANMSPYTAAAGSEVVRFPCQQNFTFVTTDGYWNYGAAADVVSNDNVESTARFCTRATGCLDERDQTDNSLADVALYWYNGGSNTGTSSLRPSLEDMTKPGLVPGQTGDNTRLHMNTYALGLGVDGIMNYEEQYDTAPAPGGDFYNLITGVTTGCPWNNNGAYVWPDPATGDATSGSTYQSRVDDLWHAAINGHGHYFSAADPTQVVQGLSSALSAIQVKVGAASAAATSTPNISQQDNDIFSSTFTTVRWFGELADRKIDPTTGVVSTDAAWTTSDTVGRLVADSSDTRTIYMADTVNGGFKSFTYANMTATEKAWFDNKCTALAQCSSLSTADRATVNAGANIVNWLRGQQQYADGTILRAYTRTDHVPTGLSATIPIVLGDIATSKPAYLRDPRKGYTAAGYATFKTDNATRSPTVFVAANDGMLHAFNAADGAELWAYMPRITMKKLYLQASTTYGTNHQYTTDGSPEIGDVKIGNAWKSVLVAGLNGGGRGYYALDVTDPAHPHALWELCADAAVCPAHNDADIGLTFGNPQFGTWVDGQGVEHWVVFLTSGYNNVPGADNVNGGSGAGYLYVVDVATGAVLNKTSTGNGDTTTPSGFARITAITANPFSDPRVTYVYGGDNQGRMYRFDFTTRGAPTRITMGDAGAAQPVTTSPEVTMCQIDDTDAQGNVTSAPRTLVVFGTGRLLDVPDVTNTDLQSVYVLKDTGVGIPAVDWRTATKMARMRLAKSTVGGTQVYAVSGTTVTWATQSAWYMDLDQNTGERVNLDPKVVSGTLNVVSNIPTSSSACSVGGTSNLYQLDVCAAKPLLYDANGSPIVGRTLSNASAAVGFLIVRLPSGALKLEATTADGKIIPIDVPNSLAQDARKAGWRRVRD